jgi:predicted RNA polymerase sigma factor
MASTGDAISAYHLEAGIAASHTVAVDDAATDWARILQLYESLSLLKPTPVVFMNRAVAISRVRGPEAGLAALDALPGVAVLETSPVFHMVRGEMCAKLGETTEALHHMRQAGILATVSAERRFIEARIGELVVGE